MHDETAIREAINRAQTGSYSRVFEREDDGGFSAWVIEFPGCYSGGDTAEEAMSNLDDAIEAWVAVTLEQGREIPPPLRETDFSGRVTLRLLPSIHERASILASREGVSLNRFLSNAVSYYVGYLTAVTSEAQRPQEPRGYAIAEPPPEA